MIIKKMHGCGNVFVLVDAPVGEILATIETSEIAIRNLPASARSKKAISDCAQEHAPPFRAAVLDKYSLVGKAKNASIDEAVLNQANMGFAEKFVSLTNFFPDGFLFVTLPKDDIRMKYYDIDRSTKKAARADMCGNGIRCVARYVRDTYYKGPSMTITTDDGPKDVIVLNNNNVSVNMGSPREFCVINPEKGLYFVNSSLTHLVYLMDKFDINNQLDLEKARQISKKTAFDSDLMIKLNHPERFHVNLVGISGQQTIEITTYEPGVGDITMACGTGATASAYIAAEVKGMQYPVTVRNRGGDVSVNMDSKNGDLYLTGPAEYINNDLTRDKICLEKLITTSIK